MRSTDFLVSSFYFNYLQIHGTPTGTKMVPSFANLFLFAPFNPTHRFIDDIFMIWTEGPEKLKILPINLTVFIPPSN